MSYLKLLALLPFLYLSSAISATDECSKDCQLSKIQAYFAHLDKVSMQGSTVADIDALLGDMHEDVEYIHAEYDANFDRATWRKAFIRNLEAGAYQDGPENITQIIHTIHGNRFVAVEYLGAYKDENGKNILTEPRLAMFGFKDGKIINITEYWIAK
ncbi:hypothetical protein KFE96_04545 [Kordiimonas sp. SCSIO 12603]|uniref:nuclear transport factor 2 family protein n=1 Tax=Kordiimonas sp. SCSIO 12603 TaxID=2829596 RepID=UPI00210724D7|nr:hypothetical protein [Kordiimonas sp. SCSIO 12603]UTW59582.1 hypothetical protein KFE96_04545 [Kordiimonas sp. SCSIO 12603]